MFLTMLALLDLTLREVVADVPHDAGAVVTFTLLLLFVGFIWHGSRAPHPTVPDEPTTAGDTGEGTPSS